MLKLYKVKFLKYSALPYNTKNVLTAPYNAIDFG